MAMGGHGFSEGTACACLALAAAPASPRAALAALGKVVPNRFGMDMPSRAFYEGVNPKTILNN